jgi:hypothetical protein
VLREVLFFGFKEVGHGFVITAEGDSSSMREIICRNVFL